MPRYGNIDKIKQRETRSQVYEGGAAIGVVISDLEFLEDRLNISYIAPPRFGVRNVAFWEYYDKFPRIVKSLNENDLEKSENEKTIGSSTKFYIHKNYIHVFKPEEV